MKRSLSAVKPSRRQIFVAGAVAAVSSAAATGTAAAAGVEGLYGSGVLGVWRNLRHTVSTDAVIRSACATNGVIMFGDSIANQDAKTLAERLHTTDDLLAVDNWSGRPTTDAVDALADWNTRFGPLPKRILMATGSNDIFNPPVMTAQIDRTMSIAGSGRIVLWVNVQVCRPNADPKSPMPVADQRNSAWVNLQLADAQKRHPNLRIVRWAEFLAGKLGRIPTYIDAGGVHLTTAGIAARAELMFQALDAAK